MLNEVPDKLGRRAASLVKGRYNGCRVDRSHCRCRLNRPSMYPRHYGVEELAEDFA